MQPVSVSFSLLEGEDCMNFKKPVFLAVILSLILSCGAFAQTAKVEGKFRVVVDYSQTLEEMIAAGRYELVSTHGEEMDFGDFHVRCSKCDVEEVTIEIIRLDRRGQISPEDALSELELMSLRPATLPELLAFGAKYPKKQRKITISAIFGPTQPMKNFFVAALEGRSLDGWRKLSFIYQWDGTWCSHCRLAAVRK